MLDIFAGIGRGKWSISCDSSKNRKADMSSIKLYPSWEDMSALRSWAVNTLFPLFQCQQVYQDQSLIKFYQSAHPRVLF